MKKVWVDSENPGPLQAVYHATKSYVLSLSQVIDEEVRQFGITYFHASEPPGPGFSS